MKVELQTTKNYKLVQGKLDAFDKLFYDDPEIVAIKKNYNDFTKEDDFKRELVLSKVITLLEYDLWKKKVLETFDKKGGTNYDKTTKKYTSIKKIMGSL